MLGLDARTEPDAAEIRRAKRRLCLATHSDKTASPGAATAFNVVIAAAEVLLDPAMRARYDTGMRAAGGAPAPAPAAAAPGCHDAGSCDCCGADLAEPPGIYVPVRCATCPVYPCGHCVRVGSRGWGIRCMSSPTASRRHVQGRLAPGCVAGRLTLLPHLCKWHSRGSDRTACMPALSAKVCFTILLSRRCHTWSAPRVAQTRAPGVWLQVFAA